MRGILTVALLALAVARPALAQDQTQYRDVIVPVIERWGFDTALRQRVESVNGEVQPLDPSIADRYRVYRVQTDRAAELERLLGAYIGDDAARPPVGALSYRDVIVTTDTPSDAPISRDIDALESTFGEDNVAFGEVVPPDIYRVTPMGADQSRITVFGDRFSIAEPLPGGAVRLENSRGGEDAILYSRNVVVDGATVLSGTIVQGDDVIEFTPVDRAGRSVFVRLVGAASARDHAPSTPAQARGREFEQRRRSERVTMPDDEMPRAGIVRGEGCRFTGNTNVVVVGWMATRSALSALNSTGFRNVDDEVASLNAALAAIGITTGSAKAFPLLAASEAWNSSASIDDAIAQVTTEGSAPAHLWRAANEGCADILLLITRIPLTGASQLTDCGAAATIATAQTAAAVVNVECFFRTRFTVAHELGHIFGACHETEWYSQVECPRVDNSVTYNFRYAWSAFRQTMRYGDVMAHWRSDHHDTGFVRLLHFSQPGKNGEDSTPLMNAGALVRQRFADVASFYEVRMRGCSQRAARAQAC